MTKKLFKKEFNYRYPSLRGILEESIDSKKRFDREFTDGKKLTFSKDSEITSQTQLEKILTLMGATVIRPSEVSKKFKNCGFLIEWEGKHYSTLIRSMIVEKSRKAFSPDNIGLGGKTYTPLNIAQFRQDIINGLTIECGDDTKLFSAIVSMLDYIEFRTPLSAALLNIKKKDLNPIICDFGEVVCAYRDLRLGIAKKEIKFPIKSNETVVDYWRDGKVISVKGPMGGGKLNLVLYASRLTSQTDVGRFLLAHAEHNRENYFKYAAKICPWINSIATLVGGTSIDNLKYFVQTPESFDEFYQLLKSKNFPGVGLPKKRWEGDWRRRWEQEQSLDPIWFSIITLVTRWGQTNQDTIAEISKIMKPLFSTEKFVNISIKDVNITTTEISFKDVNTWITHYHSNAGGAWANWPSIRVSDTK
jgi:hypothetical protein